MMKLQDLGLPAFLNDIFNNTIENNVLLLDTQGIVLAINPAFTRSFGYEFEAISGKHISILFTEEDQEKGLPGKELKAVVETGQGSDNNYLVALDSTKIWVSGEAILIHKEDGTAVIIKIIQNIHKQKESEIELGRLNTFNEDILGSINNVVIVLNEDLQLVKVNREFNNIFNAANAAIESLDFEALIHPHDNDNVLINNIKQAFATGKGFTNITVEISTSTTEKRMFEISGTMMASGTGVSIALLVFHDITFHKQLEREREDIIGFVAHELRNPLANLGLCNELLSMHLQTKNFEEATSIIERSKNNLLRLNKMIAELYNATKISSGNISLDIAPYHFEEMVKEAIDTIRILQPAYNIIVSGKADFMVEGDRYRMMEVVTNYLSNGIKYSDGSTDVLLNIKQEKNNVILSVKDKGLGIAEAQLPFIFERFFRAEKTKNLEGLGLGLYLCQRIIQNHKGKVWAESEEGHGSVFYFSVPLKLN